MRFRWTCCALVALVPIVGARAQDKAQEVTIIKMTVDAKAAPKPALKHLLLPELRDVVPGNAVHGYLICFMEQNALYYNKDLVAEREKWLVCPLSELPDNLADYGGSSSRHADHAARLEHCDWQMLLKIKEYGISLLLPEIQQLRSLANVLKVRSRGQIKARRFDDAIKSQQTMFAFARHLGEHPTLIGNLVGIAIANIAIGPLEELIQQPGAPNLYWALSSLPPSLVDLRQGMRGERMFVYAEFKEFVDANRTWNDDDVRRVREAAKKYSSLIGLEKESSDKFEAWLVARLKDDKWLAETRTWLVDMGLPEAIVKKYPAEQVMFQKLLKKYEIVRDDGEKWMHFPYWIAEPELLRIGKSKADASEEDGIASSLVAAFHKVRRAQARVDQRIAMLRIVEALRLYAAANNGKLPASLDDIKVPVPVDPMTGKAFTYKVEEGTAKLIGSPPTGEEKTAAFNIRYEVTIRK
jgi:hypothetical protein